MTSCFVAVLSVLSCYRFCRICYDFMVDFQVALCTSPGLITPNFCLVSALASKYTVDGNNIVVLNRINIEVRTGDLTTSEVIIMWKFCICKVFLPPNAILVLTLKSNQTLHHVESSQISHILSHSFLVKAKLHAIECDQPNPVFITLFYLSSVGIASICRYNRVYVKAHLI